MEREGWQVSFLVCAGVALQLMVVGSLYFPLQGHPTIDHPKLSTEMIPSEKSYFSIGSNECLQQQNSVNKIALLSSEKNEELLHCDAILIDENRVFCSDKESDELFHGEKHIQEPEKLVVHKNITNQMKQVNMQCGEQQLNAIGTTLNDKTKGNIISLTNESCKGIQSNSQVDKIVSPVSISLMDDKTSNIIETKDKMV